MSTSEKELLSGLHSSAVSNGVKLLIVTQAVNENDPVLGFFCRWVEEFAKHFETVTVIAFSVGEHHFPENVRVYSLGKERGAGRFRRLVSLYSLLYSLRGDYDAVFAHMNPEYVLAGAPVWLALGKKITLWYNHTQKSWRLSLAARFVKVIFHTSPYAASARFAQAKRMPAGIDTAAFTPAGALKNPLQVYFQGRVARAKRVDDICAAVGMVRSRGTLATLTVVGPEEKHYAEQLKNKYGTMIAERALLFLGPLKSADTPPLYSAARVSVNLTAAGNYDKTVLESMACETPVIVSSAAFSDMVPKEWVVPEHDPDALAAKIEAMLALPEKEYTELGRTLRGKVVSGHDVAVLGTALAHAFNTL